MNNDKYGWYPNEPDERDWEYSAIEKRVILPAEVDYTDHLDRIRYQWDAPSCVQHAICNQIYIDERVRGFSRRTYPSRRFMFTATLAKMHGRDNIKITGTYPRVAYQTTREIGVIREYVYKYSTKEKYIKEHPCHAARRAASSRVGLQYYAITNNKSERIRQALAAGSPVCFGTQVTDKFFNSNIIIRPDDSDELHGGHYMCITGYKGDYFIAVNSWKGHEILLFHDTFIEWKHSRDFIVIKGWDQDRQDAGPIDPVQNNLKKKSEKK